jgi:ABC-type molybdate transport system permease subunit
VHFPASRCSALCAAYILPGIIMGISLLIFIQTFGIRLSWFTVLLGHVSFTVPIVMFQIMARIARMGPNYQAAAMDLGANPAQTFWYVTLPMIRTAIVGAALLAFTVSFDEIVISFFLTGSAWMTLPVFIYGMMRFGLSPKVYAISAIILLLSLVLVILMAATRPRGGGTAPGRSGAVSYGLRGLSFRGALRQMFQRRVTKAVHGIIAQDDRIFSYPRTNHIKFLLLGFVRGSLFWPLGEDTGDCMVVTVYRPDQTI